MSQPNHPALLPAAASPGAGLLTRRLGLVLAAQSIFGFGWSCFLIQPKFLATVLAADARTIGQVSAMPAVAAVAALPLVVAGIDRIGRLPLARAGMVLLVLLSLGYLFVDRVGPLVYLLQIGVGASFVLTFNAHATLATDGVPPDRLGQVLGLLGASNMSMNAAATATAEHLADVLGWPAVFWMACAAACAGLLLSLLLREDRRVLRPASTAMGAWSGLRGPAAIFLVAACMGGAFSAMFTFHQPYALELGAAKVSSFFVGFTITAVAVRLLLGSWGDRHGRRRVSILSLVFYGLVTVAAARLEVAHLWLYGAAFGFAHGVLYPTLNAHALERAPENARGPVIALFNGSFNAGVAVSALAWGLVAQSFGYPAVFVLAGVLALAGVAVLTARSGA